jgi:hypothetical protein
LQYVKFGFIHIQEGHSGKDWRSQLWMSFQHRQGKPRQRKRYFSQEYPSCLWASDSLGCRSAVCQTCNDMPAKAVALPWISEAISLILTQVLNITQSVLIAKWDWWICSDGSVMKICTGFSSAPELQLQTSNCCGYATNFLTQVLNIA